MLNLEKISEMRGTIPPNFFETSSGHMTYTEEDGRVVITRDDVDAVGFDNLHLLSEVERGTVREAVQCFATNPNVKYIVLERERFGHD